MTVVGIVALFVFDFYVVVRKPHEPTLPRVGPVDGLLHLARRASSASALWASSPRRRPPSSSRATSPSGRCSVDNLFVFLVILARFAVPSMLRQRVLLVGVAIALVLRAIFIAVGAAALAAFSWVFYIFGCVPHLDRVLRRPRGRSRRRVTSSTRRTASCALVRRIFPATDDYRGAALWVTRERAKRSSRRMLIVIIAIGTTDVLFALDSIPAIFGLTQDPYIVFTANAFALMGLRQLFFVVQGLLARLIYLSYGLAVILGFIGVKLVFQALRENTLPFINGGEPLHGFRTSPRGCRSS